MELSIIIINFNTKEFLKKCLKSIYRYIDISAYEMIVVDNGSSDSSVEMVKELAEKNSFQFANLPGKTLRGRNGSGRSIRIDSHKPTITLIANRTNLGFAKAVNQGMKIAKGEYIFLLNPDTEVKPRALKELVKFAQNHPEAGVVGARLLNPDGSVQPSVYHFPTIWRAVAEYWFGKKGAYEKHIPSLTGTDPVRVEAVTGAAMLIPRKTIEKIGLLDERYFFIF